MDIIMKEVQLNIFLPTREEFCRLVRIPKKCAQGDSDILNVQFSVMEMLTEDPAMAPLLTPYWNIGVMIKALNTQTGDWQELSLDTRSDIPPKTSLRIFLLNNEVDCIGPGIDELPQPAPTPVRRLDPRRKQLAPAVSLPLAAPPVTPRAPEVEVLIRRDPRRRGAGTAAIAAESSADMAPLQQASKSGTGAILRLPVFGQTLATVETSAPKTSGPVVTAPSRKPLVSRRDPRMKNSVAVEASQTASSLASILPESLASSPASILTESATISLAGIVPGLSAIGPATIISGSSASSPACIVLGSSDSSPGSKLPVSSASSPASVVLGSSASSPACIVPGSLPTITPHSPNTENVAGSTPLLTSASHLKASEQAAVKSRGVDAVCPTVEEPVLVTSKDSRAPVQKTLVAVPEAGHEKQHHEDSDSEGELHIDMESGRDRRISTDSVGDGQRPASAQKKGSKRLPLVTDITAVLLDQERPEESQALWDQVYGVQEEEKKEDAAADTNLSSSPSPPPSPNTKAARAPAASTGMVPPATVSQTSTTATSLTAAKEETAKKILAAERVAGSREEGDKEVADSDALVEKIRRSMEESKKALMQLEEEQAMLENLEKERDRLKAPEREMEEGELSDTDTEEEGSGDSPVVRRVIEADDEEFSSPESPLPEVVAEIERHSVIIPLDREAGDGDITVVFQENKLSVEKEKGKDSVVEKYKKYWEVYEEEFESTSKGPTEKIPKVSSAPKIAVTSDVITIGDDHLDEEEEASAPNQLFWKSVSNRVGGILPPPVPPLFQRRHELTPKSSKPTVTVTTTDTGSLFLRRTDLESPSSPPPPPLPSAVLGVASSPPVLSTEPAAASCSSSDNPSEEQLFQRKSMLKMDFPALVRPAAGGSGDNKEKTTSCISGSRAPPIGVVQPGKSSGSTRTPATWDPNRYLNPSSDVAGPTVAVVKQVAAGFALPAPAPPPIMPPATAKIAPSVAAESLINQGIVTLNTIRRRDSISVGNFPPMIAKTVLSGSQASAVVPRKAEKQQPLAETDKPANKRESSQTTTRRSGSRDDRRHRDSSDRQIMKKRRSRSGSRRRTKTRSRSRELTKRGRSRSRSRDRPRRRSRSREDKRRRRRSPSSDRSVRQRARKDSRQNSQEDKDNLMLNFYEGDECSFEDPGDPDAAETESAPVFTAKEKKSTAAASTAALPVKPPSTAVLAVSDPLHSTTSFSTAPALATGKSAAAAPRPAYLITLPDSPVKEPVALGGIRALQSSQPIVAAPSSVGPAYKSSSSSLSLPFGHSPMDGDIVATLRGKHPVTALFEFCLRMKLAKPVFKERPIGSGWAYEVELGENVAITNPAPKTKKKDARCEVARLCLKHLGVFRSSTSSSASVSTSSKADLPTTPR